MTRPALVAVCLLAILNAPLRNAQGVESLPLDIRVNGPKSVNVGDQARYEYIVTNLGKTTITHPLVAAHFDNGLEHVDGASPLEINLKDLGPGETASPVVITFHVTRSGRLCQRVEVRNGDVLLGTGNACVNAQLQSAIPGVDDDERTAHDPAGPDRSGHPTVTVPDGISGPRSAEPEDAGPSVREQLSLQEKRIQVLYSQIQQLQKTVQDLSERQRSTARSTRELFDEESLPRQRTPGDAFGGPGVAQPGNRYQSNDRPRIRRAPIKSQPKEETNTAPHSTFDDSIFETESEPAAPPSRFTPRIKEPSRTAPAPAVPKHWQRLEINGQAFYIIPVGEIPRGDAPVIDGRLTPIRERREE